MATGVGIELDYSINPFSLEPKPRLVPFYAPFTHYLADDIIRIAFMAGVVLVGAVVGLLAFYRWKESRKSASYFLIALNALLFVDSAAQLKVFGTPITWTFYARCVALAITALAIKQALQEVRKGDWKKVPTNDKSRAAAKASN